MQKRGKATIKTASSSGWGTMVGRIMKEKKKRWR